MIAETKECSKCKRQIPLSEMNKGHEGKCQGCVGEDQEGLLYESSLKNGEESPTLRPPEEIPFYFRTRSQKKADLDEDYPEVMKKYCKDDSFKSYQEHIDHRDKNVKMVYCQTVLCPKCSESIQLSELASHTCSYSCCDFCQEYYPQDLMEVHREYCYHNPYRRYENPYSQNKKEREGMGFDARDQAGAEVRNREELGPISGRQGAENEIISTQQETVTLPDGNQVIRTIIKRPHGYSVEERRVRRQPQTTTVGGQGNVVLNPLPAFHQNNPQPVTQTQVAEQRPQDRSGSRPGSSGQGQQQASDRQQPYSGQQAGGAFGPFGPQRHHPEQGPQAPYAQGGMQLDLFHPFGSMLGHPSDVHMGMGQGGFQDLFNPVMQFMPQRNLFDNFGSFFMFGQNPFDPLMQNRAFNAPFSPFDNLLRDHVNFVRVNRNRMFDPNFVVVLLDNNANADPTVQAGPRLQKDQLSKIPITKFQKKADVKAGEEEKCPICLIDLEHNEEIRSLPCKHIFHPSCIDTWLVKNSSCPICKRDVMQGLGLAPAQGQAHQQAPGQGPTGHQDPQQGHSHGHHGHRGHNHGQQHQPPQPGPGGFFDLFRPGNFF